MRVETKYVLESHDVQRLGGLIAESENKLNTGRGKRLLAKAFSQDEMEHVARFRKRAYQWTCKKAPVSVTLPPEQYEIVKRLENVCLML